MQRIRGGFRAQAIPTARAVLARRCNSTKSPIGVAFTSGDEDEAATRYRNQKNPVIPSLANLEARWPRLDAGQQDDIIAYLEDQMRGDWRDMSTEEKRAAFYVWYGNWGPRAPNPTDFSNLYVYLAGVVGAAAAGLAVYKFATYDSSREVPGLDYTEDK